MMEREGQCSRQWEQFRSILSPLLSCLWYLLDFVNPLRDASLPLIAVLTFLEVAGQYLPWYLIIFVGIVNCLLVRALLWLVVQSVFIFQRCWVAAARELRAGKNRREERKAGAQNHSNVNRKSGRWTGRGDDTRPGQWTPPVISPPLYPGSGGRGYSR